MTKNTGPWSLLSLLLATVSFAAISAAQAQEADTSAATEETAQQTAPNATQPDAVTSTATRSPAGSGNFGIRGIGGNRVLVLVDGLPVPDSPITSTAAGSYTRDYVDLDSMKRVEIIRGPSSALYGSDGIG